MDITPPLSSRTYIFPGPCDLLYGIHDASLVGRWRAPVATEELVEVEKACGHVFLFEGQSIQRR